MKARSPGRWDHSKRSSFLLSLDEDLLHQQAVVDLNAIAAAESLGFGSVAQTVANPTHHFFGSGRVFHDRTTGDQFWMGYSYEHRSSDNSNVGGTTLPSAATDTRFLEHEINVSYLHQFSPHWLNQTRFLVGHYDSSVVSVLPDAQIAVSGLFTAGGAQADTRRTEYHFDGTDFATYASGKQQLSFGIDVPDISRRGLDDFTNRAGTYTFASAADYSNTTPATYLVQTGQGHVAFLEKVICAFVEDNIRLRPNLSVYLGMRTTGITTSLTISRRASVLPTRPAQKAKPSSAAARASFTIEPGRRSASGHISRQSSGSSTNFRKPGDARSSHAHSLRSAVQRRHGAAGHSEEHVQRGVYRQSRHRRFPLDRRQCAHPRRRELCAAESKPRPGSANAIRGILEGQRARTHLSWRAQQVFFRADSVHAEPH
jgi:hypothetical protein